jgi:hypothetical protein
MPRNCHVIDPHLILCPPSDQTDLVQTIEIIRIMKEYSSAIVGV